MRSTFPETGLIHPADLRAWRRWQARRNGLRTAKNAVSAGFRRLGRTAPTEPTGLVLHARGERPTHVVALETTGPTQRAALLSHLSQAGDRAAAVVAPQDVSAQLPGGDWRVRRVPATPEVLDAVGAGPSGTGGEELAGVRDVVAVGHYLPVGDLLHRWARPRGIRFHVVQHGLLAPMAPPLPPEAHLLAFSAADAEFWTAGRTDVSSTVIGSQLLWEAARLPKVSTDPGQRPVYLGQLHGAELSRWGLARSSGAFCRATDAVYRPHPGERDLASRLVHAWWRRRGIRIDDSGTPLSEVRAPVVSAFSTGILEGAARGLDAWAHHADPPPWLRAFWDRYGMSTWGQEPTRAPVPAPREPAARIADILYH